MSSPSDLVSLAAVQAWLGQTSDSANLSNLITQVSRTILTSLSRPKILPSNYTELRDGDGRWSITLRNWPVIAVSPLLVDGQTIVAAPAMTLGAALQPGYLVEQVDAAPPGQMQTLSLRCECFRRGVQNVAVSYTAGYQISAEAQFVPAVSPYTITPEQPYGLWGSDGGVTYASGTPLVSVSAAPSVGQYSVAAGVYTFAAADAGAGVLLTYGFVPADLAQVAMEWVAERYLYKSRIGQRSKTLGGQETVTYDLSAIPAFVAMALQPYRRVAWPC